MRAEERVDDVRNLKTLVGLYEKILGISDPVEEDTPEEKCCTIWEEEDMGDDDDSLAEIVSDLRILERSPNRLPQESGLIILRGKDGSATLMNYDIDYQDLIDWPQIASWYFASDLLETISRF